MSYPIMKREWLITVAAIVAAIILCLILLILFQKPFVTLEVNGKVVAVARRFVLGPVLNDSSTDIYAGNKKIFSLREDFFDTPFFIYPFADGKRFLCDYDGDVAMLDFIVDFRNSNTNELNSPEWPSDNQLRADLSRMATNVVFDTRAIIRLPTYAELQEVSSYLTNTTSSPIKAGYFQFFSSGAKADLLLDLATNRQSAWPTKK
jgi:hypothetical protein